MLLETSGAGTQPLLVATRKTAALLVHAELIENVTPHRRAARIARRRADEAELVNRARVGGRSLVTVALAGVGAVSRKIERAGRRIDEARLGRDQGTGWSFEIAHIEGDERDEAHSLR